MTEPLTDEQLADLKSCLDIYEGNTMGGDGYRRLLLETIDADRKRLALLEKVVEAARTYVDTAKKSGEWPDDTYTADTPDEDSIGWYESGRPIGLTFGDHRLLTRALAALDDKDA
jgi:hypothetical protein